MTERRLRIGGASGAWGDSPGGLPQLLGAGVDYVMMDYLAEVTMSLLARARLRDPAAGFPPDFLAFVTPHLGTLAKQGVRLVTNAGGVNPLGCKAALEAAIAAQGLALKVGVVLGDDVLELPITAAATPKRLLTANAYLGALPIAAALAAGADIVITGRCVDSALALGILMHEFGWAADDYPKLGAGSLVGHILECGPQATGGTFTDWDLVPDSYNIGYPIADCAADGSFIVGKPDGTGGLVTIGTVGEQMLYEVGDPAAYLLPDVAADFSQVRLRQIGLDRVLVENAGGRAPGPRYKVSATYQDGYRATATMSIVGPRAAEKAERTAAALLARAATLFAEARLAGFTATQVEALGAEASYPARTSSREVLLRVVVLHPSRAAIDLFAREVGAFTLAGVPGTTGIYGGRPKATPQVRLFTFFVDKAALPAPIVRVGDGPDVVVPVPVSEATAPGFVSPPALPIPDGPTVTMKLSRLAFARSGDKGDSSNVAIIARRPDLLPLLRREVTVERVLDMLGHLAEGPATRFEAPGIHALNFVIENALGGGGMASLRIDPQGKAYGQMVLEMEIAVPMALLPGD